MQLIVYTDGIKRGIALADGEKGCAACFRAVCDPCGNWCAYSPANFAYNHELAD